MARKYTEARKDSNKKWDADNLERISVVVPFGKKAIIKYVANNKGESVNAFINRAIDEALYKEGNKNMMNQERRIRYLLNKHGITLHKERADNGDEVFYMTDAENEDRPDAEDERRWFSLGEIEAYCEKLKLQEKESKE